MKKIGVISDIHGNLPALNAVLDLLDSEGCEEIIHTGDVVDIGPNSRECLDVLLSRKDVVCLIGNHDRDFAVNQPHVRNLSHVPTEHKQQVFATLTENHRQKVRNFPLYTVRNCGKSKLLFCHYAFKQEPFSIDVFPFMPIANPPTAEAFDEMFAGLDCDAVFFGHKHEPCDVVGERLYVDVGSVGCHPDPYARAIVIEYDDEQWSYRRVYAPYDMQSTRNKMHSEIACGEQLYDFYFLLNTGVRK
ncbi:MAG: metallophosphoesterase family protein [Clostridiales bacterium]|nr:metallophosphoesterase family protein [Clostridiales bacterium]